MLVEGVEIPELHGDDHAEEPRVWHDAARLYLARALDGRSTMAHAARAASCLRRALVHPALAGWPLARAILVHDLGLACLLAAEVARGERERRLLRRARQHLEAAAAVAAMAGPPQFRGLALHNLAYARGRLAALGEEGEVSSRSLDAQVGLSSFARA